MSEAFTRACPSSGQGSPGLPACPTRSGQTSSPKTQRPPRHDSEGVKITTSHNREHTGSGPLVKHFYRFVKMDLAKIVKTGFQELVQAGRNARAGLRKRRIPVLRVLDWPVGDEDLYVVVAGPTRQIVRRKRRPVTYFAVFCPENPVILPNYTNVIPLPTWAQTEGAGSMGYWSEDIADAHPMSRYVVESLLAYLVLQGEGRWLEAQARTGEVSS